MKIRKVEIQAFRAYDSVENGTFDFLTESNEVADFISIYAPNGFGKTSFYDAVEWGYTNKISRFDRKKGFNSDHAKAERNLSAENDNKKKQWIIRNKDSQLENGFVKLYTTAQDAPFERSVPKVSKGEPDYKFEKQEEFSNTKNFHEVLLSQEWIDAFLKEDDAATRYEKFTSSFGDVELDAKYRTVVELIKVNNDEIKELIKSQKGIQTKLNMDFDHDLLTKVNSAIDELKSRDENLPKVQESFTEKDNLKLSNLITDRKNDLESLLRKLREREQKIDEAISGSQEGQVGLDGYFEAIQKLNETSALLKKLSENKALLESRTKTRQTISELRELLQKKLEEVEKLEKLLKVFPAYQKAKEEIENENYKIGKQEEKLPKVSQSLDNLIEKENELKAKRAVQQKELQKYSSLLEKLPETLKLLADLEVQISVANTGQENKGLILEKLLETIKIEGNKLQSFLEFIESIDRGEIPTAEHRYFKEHSEALNGLLADQTKLEKIKDLLKALETESSKTDSLNQELKKLIEQGTTLLNNNQSSTCPLCLQEYDSFSVLMGRIMDNPLLEEQASKLLNEKNELEQEQSTLTAQRKENSFELLTILREKAIEKESTLNASKLKADELREEIATFQESVITVEEKASNLLSDLELTGLPKEGFETNVRKRLDEIKQQITEIDKLVASNAEEKKGVEEQLTFIKSQIESIKIKIKRLKQNEDYLKLLSYQAERLTNKTLEKGDLEKEEADSLKEIEGIQENLKIEESNLKELARKLEGVSSLEMLEKSIATNEEKKDELRKKTQTFETFLRSQLEITVTELSREVLLQEIEKGRKATRDELTKVKWKFTQYVKVEEYKQNVLPFLDYQKNIKKSINIKAELKFLREIVKVELEKEKKSLSDFIHTQVESFFYQDLINTLYQKIDPHPTYKEISFKCDFSTEKPKLNIFVKDENDTIVPTLYFSTAQLNILSLSIFLAKALNVKDESGKSVDCIFIDDPIQSMDSINVLSTIDLFRSIVVNQGKQIILSTHDENFQNLLKKKIPDDLFPAKYLELETFGKVKR